MPRRLIYPADGGAIAGIPAGTFDPGTEIEIDDNGAITVIALPPDPAPAPPARRPTRRAATPDSTESA